MSLYYQPEYYKINTNISKNSIKPSTIISNTDSIYKSFKNQTINKTNFSQRVSDYGVQKYMPGGIGIGQNAMINVPNAGWNSTINYYHFEPAFTVKNKNLTTSIGIVGPLNDKVNEEEEEEKINEFKELNYYTLNKDLIKLKKDELVVTGLNYLKQMEDNMDKIKEIKEKNNEKIKEKLRKFQKKNEEKKEESKQQQVVISNEREVVNEKEGEKKSTEIRRKKDNKISKKDMIFIKKYARYLLFKHIKEVLTQEVQEPIEKICKNETLFCDKNKEEFIESVENAQIESYKNSDIATYVAFCKLIFSVLDKENTGLITKEKIKNDIKLDDKILNDLCFVSKEEFNKALDEFEPESKENKDKNLMNENDFCHFLLKKAGLKEEVLKYFSDSEDFIFSNSENEAQSPVIQERQEKSAEDNNKNHTETEENVQISNQNIQNKQNLTENFKQKLRDDLKDNEILITDEEDSDFDLPGMRTHVFDFLEEKNNKLKLDGLLKVEKEHFDKEKKLLPLNKEKVVVEPNFKNLLKILYAEYVRFVTQFKTKSQLKFTIPKPFDFLKIDYQKKKLEKMKEILSERVKIEDYYINYRIRANKLKEGIWGDKLQGFVEFDKQQRAKRCEKLNEKIIADMKPFSFYDRDERKYKERISQEYVAPSFPPFRAGAIKWLTQIDMYQDMLFDQAELRKIRTAERAKVLLENSRLPPRMHMHQQEEIDKKNMRILEEKNAQLEKDRLRKFHANPVPDFKRLQNEFETKLESQKKAAKLTVPEPFNFREPKKDMKIREFLDDENKPNAKNPKYKTNIKKIIEKMNRKPKLEPKSTHGLDLLMETRRKELEEKQRKIKERELEDEIRFERQNRLKERVNNSSAIVDNKKQLEENRRRLEEEFKKDLREKRISYQNELARRKQKVYNRPLLIEQMGNQEKYSMVNPYYNNFLFDENEEGEENEIEENTAENVENPSKDDKIYSGIKEQKSELENEGDEEEGNEGENKGNEKEESKKDVNQDLQKSNPKQSQEPQLDSNENELDQEIEGENAEMMEEEDNENLEKEGENDMGDDAGDVDVGEMGDMGDMEGEEFEDEDEMEKVHKTL